MRFRNYLNLMVVRQLFSLSLLIILVVFWDLPAKAQGAPALIRTDPTVLEVIPGEVYEVTIVLENVFEAYGIDVRMAFDPGMIEIIDANPDLDGIQVQQGDFPQPDFAVLYVADNNAGTISYVITQTSPTLPASGSGTVFTIEIRGKSAGESLLAFETVEISNRDGFLLDIATQDGRLVPEGSGSEVTPGPVVVLPSATAPLNSNSVPTATADPLQATVTSAAATSTSDSSADSATTNPSPSQTAAAANEPAATSESPTTAAQTADNLSVEQSTAEVDANGVAEITESENESETAGDEAADETSQTAADPESGQEPQTVGESIAQNQPVEEAAPAATPEIIGSERNMETGAENAVSTNETANSAQTVGPGTGTLFILALIVLALVLIGLIVLLNKRRSSSE